jgi:arylsulfate sulfotransferase
VEFAGEAASLAQDPNGERDRRQLSGQRDAKTENYMKIRCLLMVTASVGIAACGGGGATVAPQNPAFPNAAAASSASTASVSNLAVASISAGVTPFIAIVQLTGSSLASMQSIEFTIKPKPGSVSKRVDVTFTQIAMIRRGYLAPDFSALSLPIFGLYAGYDNEVSLNVAFEDGSVQTIPIVLTTAAYTDPNGIYDRPVINKARDSGSRLGFSFFVLKSNLGTPVVIDTDAEIRWVATGVSYSQVSNVFDNGFEIAGQIDTTVYRLELDGSIAATSLSFPNYLSFNHNLDPGREGFLGEIATSANPDSTVGEFAYEGPANSSASFINRWDFAQILTEYMQSNGDDPSAFVRPSVDWFHANAAIYDKSDNSLIVSSRENFLMKVDYDSGAIIWIFGDPTKYWYTFPSLRAKAITLVGGGLYPIGQHGVSITSDGNLMVMNDGEGSVNQPPGAPAGQTRSYSAVSAYAIDPVSRTATQVLDFDYDKSIDAPFCGSAYEARGRSLLVDFATAAGFSTTRLIGLDIDQNVVFDFQYANALCNTAWNAVPIFLDSMQFQ